MKLRAYLFAGFARFFALAGAGFLVLFFLAEVLSDLPDALRTHQPFCLLSYAKHLPLMFTQISPVVTFLSALLVVSEMMRGNELRMLEVSGIPPVRVATALLAAGLAVSVFSFWCREQVVSPLQERAVHELTLAPVHFSSPCLSVSAERLVATGEMEQVMLSVAQGDARYRVRARRAEFDGTEWVLRDAALWVFDARGACVNQQTAGRMRLLLPLTPADIRDAVRTPDALSASRIRRLLARLQVLDVRPLPLVVALHERFAYPLLNLFILLAGMPMMFPREKTGRIVVIGLAVFASFFSYVVYSFGVALAQGGKIPAWAGVWLFHIAAAAFFLLSVLRGGQFSRIIPAQSCAAYKTRRLQHP